MLVSHCQSYLLKIKCLVRQAPHKGLSLSPPLSICWYTEPHQYPIIPSQLSFLIPGPIPGTVFMPPSQGRASCHNGRLRRTIAQYQPLITGIHWSLKLPKVGMKGFQNVWYQELSSLSSNFPASRKMQLDPAPERTVIKKKPSLQRYMYMYVYSPNA